MKFIIIVLNKKNVSDFAKARNKVLRDQVGPNEMWILFLDSDEVMSPGLKTEIENLIPGDQINGYYIPREGIVEEKILRLARKGAGLWQRRVHEVWQIKGKVGYLKNPIVHNDIQDLGTMISKINFYSTLHAEANSEEGKHASLFKILFYPKLKFLQTFFVKKAYKKGVRGFVFSLMQAFGSYLSWTKLYFLQS